jgi:endonuclease-8
MAEGPLVHHYANQLRSVLKGKEVRVVFGIRKLKQLEPSLESLRIQDVEAHGKQLRIHFPDNRVLLVHLMMWGSWRIYRNGQTWDKPRQRARVIFRTETHEVVAFSTPIVQLLSQTDLERDPRWGNAGPDPLRPDFSKMGFFRLLDTQADREIGEVLLDQRVISGIGNILRVEILFQSRVHPRRLVGSLSDDERNEILRWILRLTKTWMRQIGKRSNWIHIYRKSNKPCPHCGARIEFLRQAGRLTYACPSCQQLPGSS